MTQPNQTSNRTSLAFFGFALIVVGIAIFVMGPQSLTYVLDHGVWNAPSAVLFLFGGGGVAFILGSVLYKRKMTVR